MMHNNIYIIKKIHSNDAKTERKYLIGAVGTFEQTRENTEKGGYCAGNFKTLSGEDNFTHFFHAVIVKKVA